MAFNVPNPPRTGFRHIDPRNNTLFNHFGYNNACLYIDDLPAKYVALWIAELFTICWVGYLCLSWAGYHLSHRRGMLSRTAYRRYAYSTAVDFVLVTYFIECFGVHPDESFVMHTIPFTGLIISVCNTG